MKDQQKKVFSEFVRNYGGAILIWAGPEGCGKSSRIQYLQSALENVVPTPAIFFSRVVGDFCRKKVDALRGVKNAAKRRPYEDALEKMQERRKDIDPQILTQAFREALHFMPRPQDPNFGNFGITNADGCLRLPDQVSMAVNVFADLILPTNPTVIVELQTSPEIAFRRAMARGGMTDTEDNIRRAHREFAVNMAKVLTAAKPYADHIRIDVSADDADINNSAVSDALCAYLTQVMDGRRLIKTLIPAGDSVAA